MVVDATADDMVSVGLNCIGFAHERLENQNQATKDGHFLCAFGVDPIVASIVFRDIQVRNIGNNTIDKPKVPYFLLALHWLKRYPVEQMSSGIFGYHSDTVRRWVWKYCCAIQALKPYKVSTFIYS
jgi:hypothetical protein